MIIDEIFQIGNQYAMLKDNTIVATKRTMTTTSEPRHNGGSRGKRGREGQDRESTYDSKESRRTSYHNVFGRTREQVDENPRRESGMEHT